MEQVILQLTPREAADEAALKRNAAAALHTSVEKICGIRIKKRSVDARQRDIKVLLTIDVALTQQDMVLPAYPAPVYKDVRKAKRQVLIVGAGPAGLFAALTLLEYGVRPVILERGKNVSERKRDIAALNKNEGLCPNSNYCFGEGGAGTFSDGKLFSRSKKRGDMQRVLELFHFFGANDSVLYETHAHIGSDRLPAIIRRMREAIIEYGGEIHFGEYVTGIEIGRRGPECNVERVTVRTESGKVFDGEAVILAIGHSAHDTYRLLAETGISLEAKGFAMGVRVEHPQELINRLMYHIRTDSGKASAGGAKFADETVRLLGNASYSLLTHVHERSVYSFCMCPGGHIVPAGSSAESIVVNGMSASHRNSPYANSGMVVEVRQGDITENTSGTDAALRCLEWVEQVEHRCWEEGAKAVGQPHTALAPAQRLRDFVEGRESKTLPSVSYLPGCVTSRLDQWLPAAIATRLRQAFRDFDKKYPGFLTNDAVVVGVESRSSSPVRISRDTETGRAFNRHGDLIPVYPAGEGAGYAGGITSSALDGINIAMKIIEN